MIGGGVGPFGWSIREYIAIPGYDGSWLDWLQTGSWFWSFFVALVAYHVLMSLFGRQYIAEQTGEDMREVGRAPRTRSEAGMARRAASRHPVL